MDKYMVKEPQDVKKWNALILKAMINIANDLSQISKSEIKIKKINLGLVQREKISDIYGEPDTEVMAIFIGLSGANKGRLIFTYPVELVNQMLDIFNSDGAGNLDGLNKTNLVKLANLTCKAYINSISEIEGLELYVNQGITLVDKYNSFLDVIPKNLLQESSTFYLIEATLFIKDHLVSGDCLLFSNISQNFAN